MLRWVGIEGGLVVDVGIWGDEWLVVGGGDGVEGGESAEGGVVLAEVEPSWISRRVG